MWLLLLCWLHVLLLFLSCAGVCLQVTQALWMTTLCLALAPVLQLYAGSTLKNQPDIGHFSTTILAAIDLIVTTASLNFPLREYTIFTLPHSGNKLATSTGLVSSGKPTNATLTEWGCPLCLLFSTPCCNLSILTAIWVAKLLLYPLLFHHLDLISSQLPESQ